jgi:hypothetical protein
MQLRKTMALVSALSVTALAAPAVAGAATPHATRHTAAPTATTVKSLSNVPVSGKAHNGKAFSGHMNITNFVSRGGKTYAVGTLTGRLGNRSVKATQVEVPASVPAAVKSSVMRAHATSSTTAAAAACPVLHLVLGPLNLNLLGLKVSLNQVVLNITAQPGPGNLLGNLVCSVSNLLNTQSVLGQELTGLLNIVNSVLGSPGVLSL